MNSYRTVSDLPSRYYLIWVSVLVYQRRARFLFRTLMIPVTLVAVVLGLAARIIATDLIG